MTEAAYTSVVPWFGAMRGLLCGRCNKAIGMFQDSEELMLKAIEYLRRGKAG